jgi:hypothetical protein
MMDGSRRGARIATRFLVAVEGVDPAPVLRKGDISATGIYFETERDVGEVGTVQSLALASLDRSRSVRVMAHVVRTVKLADVAGRHLSGAAFEFMPESDEAAAHVHEFVRRVLSVRKSGDPPSIAPRLGARVTDVAPDFGDERDASVQSVSVRSMVLETSWAIRPGEHLRVDIVAPGMTRRLRLDGMAVRVEPRPGSPTRYDIEVAVQQELKRPIRIDSTMAMDAIRIDPASLRPAEEVTQPGVARPLPESEDDVTHVLDDLLSALILPPEDPSVRPRRTHLSGELSRIRLPTLCSLFEMERLTGKLLVSTRGAESHLFFDGGRIVDVEPLTPDESRRSHIGRLLAATEGTFEFLVEPVQRSDQINISTTALLLDLLREADETGAPRSTKGAE